MVMEEVVPGVMVNTQSGFKVSVDHPDPVWIIFNEDESGTIASDGQIYVFSSQEKAESFIEKSGLQGGYIKEFTWDGLVDRYGSIYQKFLTDHTGINEINFYAYGPLRKEI